jgi:hypothetical protein
VLSIKLIYLELLISHFIRPVESAELPNVAHVSKSLETPGIEGYARMFYARLIGKGEKVEVVIYFKILCWYPPGMAEECQEIPPPR